MTKPLVTNSLYINLETINELDSFGPQGQVVRDALSIPVVESAIQTINILAMKSKMYPETPLAALGYCSLDSIAGVIVGGMPVSGELKSWTGSGYSYDNKSNYHSDFHYTVAASKKMQYNVDKLACDNAPIQDKGVLMLHDALSTTEKDVSMCMQLWEPFIWCFLNHISREDATIPILFSSGFSHAKFASAVRSSNNVMVTRFSSELSKSKPEMLLAFESLARMKDEKVDLSLFDDLMYADYYSDDWKGGLWKDRL